MLSDIEVAVRLTVQLLVIVVGGLKLNAAPEFELAAESVPQPVAGLRARFTPLLAGSAETVGVIESGPELASILYDPEGDSETEIPGCTVMLTVAVAPDAATEARTRVAVQADAGAV